jgi:hypothetical protein
MLYEYKIQKLIDGNNEIRYKVKLRRLNDGWIFVNFRKIFNIWHNLTWDSEHNFYCKTGVIYYTIKDAQNIIAKEIERDKASERSRLAKKRKVLEEFKYKMVPNYVPEEQIEKFITTSKKVRKDGTNNGL